MSKLNIFKPRYLIALILLVILLVGVGNAAALTVNSATQNVVEGDGNNYAADTATITYTINGSGDVIARATFTTDAYSAVSASFDGGTTYTPCIISGASPSATWDCTLSNANIAAAASIHLVATTDS